jgi:hypothetical protein
VRPIHAKFVLLLALIPTFSVGISAQQPQANVTATTVSFPVNSTLSPVTGSISQIGGSPSTAHYWYWLVPNYVAGAGAVSMIGDARNAPNPLNSADYEQISINFNAPGLVSVDVLRTTSVTPPSGACNCAVATAVTSGVVNDQSNSLSSYTVSPFNLQTLGLALDNEPQSAGVSHLILRQNGVFVSDLSTGGGTGTFGGDLQALTGTTQKVIGLDTVPFCAGFTPANGQVLQYTTASTPNPCYTAAPVGTPAGSFGGLQEFGVGDVFAQFTGFLDVTPQPGIPINGVLKTDICAKTVNAWMQAPFGWYWMPIIGTSVSCSMDPLGGGQSNPVNNGIMSINQSGGISSGATSIPVSASGSQQSFPTSGTFPVFIDVGAASASLAEIGTATYSGTSSSGTLTLTSGTSFAHANGATIQAFSPFSGNLYISCAPQSSGQCGISVNTQWVDDLSNVQVDFGGVNITTNGNYINNISSHDVYTVSSSGGTSGTYNYIQNTSQSISVSNCGAGSPAAICSTLRVSSNSSCLVVTYSPANSNAAQIRGGNKVLILGSPYIRNGEYRAIPVTDKNSTCGSSYTGPDSTDFAIEAADNLLTAAWAPSPTTGVCSGTGCGANFTLANETPWLQVGVRPWDDYEGGQGTPNGACVVIDGGTGACAVYGSKFLNLGTVTSHCYGCEGIQTISAGEDTDIFGVNSRFVFSTSFADYHRWGGGASSDSNGSGLGSQNSCGIHYFEDNCTGKTTDCALGAGGPGIRVGLILADGWPHCPESNATINNIYWAGIEVEGTQGALANEEIEHIHFQSPGDATYATASPSESGHLVTMPVNDGASTTGFSTGSNVIVSGFTGTGCTGYNGSVFLSSASGTTITYDVTATGLSGSCAVSGTTTFVQLAALANIAIGAESPAANVFVHNNPSDADYTVCANILVAGNTPCKIQGRLNSSTTNGTNTSLPASVAPTAANGASAQLSNSVTFMHNTTWNNVNVFNGNTGNEQTTPTQEWYGYQWTNTAASPNTYETGSTGEFSFSYPNGAAFAGTVGSTGLMDGSGNSILAFSSAGASVADYFQIANSLTGSPATLTLSAMGSDSNISINLRSKGSGTIQCNGASCGSGGTINNAAQYSEVYYSAAGSTNTVSGVAAPTTNGDYYQGYHITGSAASAPLNVNFLASTTNAAGITITPTYSTAALKFEATGSALTLGTDGSVAGTVQLSNSAAAFHTILGSAATANNTFNFPASVPTNLHALYCAVSGTICTLTDAGYAYNAIPASDISSGALASGMTATSQSACDNSTKLATTAYAGLTCNTVETSGSPLSATAQSQTLWNNTSGAYVVDLPTPTASGPQICLGNYKTVAHAISFVPGTGVTIYYKGVAGTSGSSTGLVSGGAAGDFICVEGTDTTSYIAIGAGQGSWTNN